MKYYHGFFLILIALISVLIVPVTVSAQEAAPIRIAAYTEEAVLFREIPSVYGASKYEQKVTEAPSSVSIVTADEIKKYGYRTIADVLRSIRGFYVTYDRNYSYVGVRGFGRPTDYNTRILVLIDGHRANDNIYDGAYVGTESIIDIDLVDRVEVIRGTGSSLYGSNAFFGVVNIITKRGRDLKGGEVSVEAGRYKTYKGRASYGDRYVNGGEVLISGTSYDSKGGRLFYPEYNDPATNFGITDHTDFDRFQSLFAKFSRNDLTLTGACLGRTKGIPTSSFFTDFNDPRNRTKDKRAFLDLKYDRTIGGTDITARLYYDHYRYIGDYIYGGITNKDLGSGDWLGGELRLSRRFQNIHHAILGVEYTGYQKQDQENYDFETFTVIMPKDERRSRTIAVYVQDEIALSRNMLLNAGVRYDDTYTFGGSTNPRVALIYNTEDTSTIKVLYGSAFRTPNAFELYWHSNTTDANPFLKPETIKTYELSYERSLTEWLRAFVGGYYYRTKDLISQTISATGNTIFQNMNGVTARGGELDLEGKWKNGIEGRAIYTVQRAENTETGSPITNSPAQQIKLNINAPVLGDRVFAGIEEQYMSRRRTEAGRYAGGFAVTNLTLFARNLFIKRLELSASVYNLFNKRYADPVSRDFLQDAISQDLRNYRVKLVYSF